MKTRKNHPRVKKRKLRLGRVFILGIMTIAILISISLFPVFEHIKGVRSSLDSYDVEALTTELAWFDEHAGWLKHLPLIRDGELWLKLSQGEYDGLEERLQAFGDDKHQFWLLQAHLLMGEGDKAQADLVGLESESYHALAEALIQTKTGDYSNAKKKLELAADSDLNLEERVLKAITLSRLEMAVNNYEGARAAWTLAQKMAVQHPLVIEMEWDLALAKGQWGRALELSELLKNSPGNSSRTELMLTKKALLSLTVGERLMYEEIVAQLAEQKNGEALISYLTGNDLYAQGDFKGASERLKNALMLGLPDWVRGDAENALAQAKERIEIDPVLSKLS